MHRQNKKVAASGGSDSKVPCRHDSTRRHSSWKLGEISQPVTTNFGVHLIKCQEIRNGKIGFRDAYPKVRARLMEQAFNELADARRPETTIEYFDHWPHYVDGLLKPAGSGR